VGTDPGLALKTRKGTGLYKIPSLRGVWYRGLFGHDSSVKTLEEWFDPARLREDYVPSGFKGYHVSHRAVPGHEFGLNLNAEEKAALIAFLRTGPPEFWQTTVITGATIKNDPATSAQADRPPNLQFTLTEAIEYRHPVTRAAGDEEDNAARGACFPANGVMTITANASSTLALDIVGQAGQVGHNTALETGRAGFYYVLDSATTPPIQPADQTLIREAVHLQKLP
jgi:hypothetical protein